MSSTSKAKPKKLRDGSTIAVDAQILRWRRKLSREGVVLGRHMEKAKELRERRRKAREYDTAEKIRKKKWFG